MDITLTVTVDDPKVLSQIAALLDGDAPVTEPTRATVQAAAPAEKPKRTQKPKAEPTRAAVLEDLPEDDATDEAKDEQPVPTPDDSDAEEAAAGDDGADRSLDDAIKLATDMVAAGKTRQVRAALNAVGVKRVSEVKPKDLATFFEKLDA